MPVTKCPQCGGAYPWSWEDAFEKFGFGDGEGVVMTEVVADVLRTAGYTVTADARHAAWLVTAHVATGSLILVTSLLVALRSVRFAWRGSRTSRLSVEPRLAEAAR